ncbi:MAG: efflux RND transporter permease subunit, partial [Planctomycetota bacterium]
MLPIEKTPDITPPTVEVTATYPGASAQVIADTVAAPIEEEVNGVDNMIYMASQSASDGSMNLTVTFEVGTDVDMSQVLVQNRVAIAEPLLPEDVRRQGVKTEKKSTNLTIMVNLISPDDRYDELYLSNYINLYIKDILARVPGVGSVTVFGAKDFGM